MNRVAAVTFSFFLVLFLPLAVSAQDFGLSSPLGGSAPPQKVLVSLSLSFDKASYAAGEPVKGTLAAKIEPEWHINSARPKDEFAIPTVLKIESAALENVAISYPAHVERAFEFAGGAKLAVYEGTVQIPFTATRTAATDLTVRAILGYQACNDKVCLPPKDAVVTAQLGANVAAAAPSGSFTPLSEAPPDSGKPVGLFSGDIAGVLSSRGLPLTLFVILVLGLALNLTPCVYPLIPITVAFFSSQTEGKRSRQFGLAVFYVLGLALTYSVLGVFSALSGRLFGAWLQSPVVLIFFAALMLVMSASMFGAFEIRVPHFITDRAGARSGFVGAMTMGLLAGIVAAPCVGPFIISLIALVSQSGNIGLGFVLFFVLALGLGLPYLILGMFSTGLAAMPRSGPWMVQIKQALGFVLIAMAFYFLRPMVGDLVYGWGAAVSLLAGATFLIVRRPQGAAAGSSVRFIAAVLLLAGGVFFAYQVSRPKEATIQWVKFDETKLAGAAASQKPVMIDFYADWCLPCKELDKNTFTDVAVRGEAERFVPLKADLTRTADPETKKLSEKYKILGVPTIVFLDASGKEIEALRLTGFEEASKFLERMKKAR
jgi:thiol:disulfide interchange protein DsbD